MGDNSDVMEDDYVFMDSESDIVNKVGPLSATVKTHGSDSNLAMRNGAINGAASINKLRFKDVRLSDSKLYKRSIGNDLHPKRLSLNFSIGGGSTQSLRDEVFKEETHSKDDNYEEIDVNGIADDDTISLGSYDSRNGSTSVSRSSSVKQEHNLTVREHQVYYAGENGSIIVPKICLDGEEVFTTFEEIDPSKDIDKGLEEVDPEIYQDKVVAMEIAREMAKLDKLESAHSTQSVSEENLPDTFAKDLNMINNENGKISSPKLSMKYTTSQDIQTKSTQNSSALHLSRFGQNNVPHIGGSLPYEELKSSTPDIRISFHTENCEVIYINEKDELTKL